MAKVNLSFKHIAIDKTAKTIITVVTIVAVILVFTVSGSRQLISKLSYQNRVIAAKQEAKNKLDENVKVVNKLKVAYQTFEDKSPSVIGSSDQNSKVVLDALPSKYDFPALTSSLEKILNLSGTSITSIEGTDEEIAQSGKSSAALVDIPFTVSVDTNYGNAQKLIDYFDKSIRPIHILSMEFDGGDQKMKFTIKAKTFYQTEQRLDISTKEVK